MRAQASAGSNLGQIRKMCLDEVVPEFWAMGFIVFVMFIVLTGVTFT
jgi:hypothetical protein